MDRPAPPAAWLCHSENLVQAQKLLQVCVLTQIRPIKNLTSLKKDKSHLQLLLKCEPGVGGGWGREKLGFVLGSQSS